MNWSHVRLIWHRELRDQLRDRRTIFTLAVLPLVLYPLLGMTFLKVMQFLAEHPTQIRLIGTQALPAEPQLVRDGAFAAEFCGPDEARLLPVTLWPSLPAEAVGQARELYARGEISAGRCDALVFIPPRFATDLARLRARLAAARAGVDDQAGQPWPRVPAPQLLADHSRDSSRIAHDRVERVLSRWREAVIRSQLGSLGVPVEATRPFEVVRTDVSEEVGRRAAVWSKVLPFVLLIWALTGAFYPAIDLCPGEKERGTLETLLCSPARRSEIVGGKLLTVVTFSTATALLNLASMVLTGLLIFGRFASLGGAVGALQIGAPPPSAILWLLLASLPVSLLFSAVALAVAAFARSSKEGQYYLMPLLLISLPLMILALLPAAELTLGTSLIPVTGLMLWLRTLIEGEYLAAWRFALPVLAVTAGCGWLAVRWAIYQFETEEVLFRDSERVGPALWLKHLARDRGDTPSVAEALAGSVVLLLVTFFGGLYVSVPTTWAGFARLVLATQLGLVLLPILIMTAFLVRKPRQTLLLNLPPWGILLVAGLLPMVLHPAVRGLGELVQLLYPPNATALKTLEPALATIREAPWWQLILVIGLTPALCEELAFRGFILSGLRRLGNAWAAIGISSVVFGLTHGILQQSLNTIAIGCVLGYLALRTRSLWPGVLFHLTHNSLTALADRAGPERLAQVPWLGWWHPPEGSQLASTGWVGITLSVLLGGLLLAWVQRHTRGT